MKSLTDYCKANNLSLVPITYRAQGIRCKRKGFDIVKPSGEIVISFEPYDMTYYKWYVRNAHDDFNSKRYMRTITAKWLRENIDLTKKSFYRLTQANNNPNGNN